jgi:kinesin family protein 3/17
MIGKKGDKNTRGIIPNAFDHIFGYFDDAQNNQKKFLIRCSYLEIYNESIRDLLSKKVDTKLDLKEHPDKGVYVQDLTTVIVKSIPEIESHMDHGNHNRKTGETAMNKDSSRSHSIFTIYVETAQLDDEGS